MYKIRYRVNEKMQTYSYDTLEAAEKVLAAIQNAELVCARTGRVLKKSGE